METAVVVLFVVVVLVVEIVRVMVRAVLMVFRNYVRTTESRSRKAAIFSIMWE